MAHQGRGIGMRDLQGVRPSGVQQVGAVWMLLAIGASSLAMCATGLAASTDRHAEGHRNSCGSSYCQSNADTCNVAGGSRSNPTKLGDILSKSTDCTVFVLSDGYYAPTVITRSGVTIRAANRCRARLQPELQIRASNVVVDGVAVSAPETAVTVYEPGVHVRNSCIRGFGRAAYGNGIWIFQQALDPINRIFVENNTLDDWGGYMYSGGIAIGKEADNPYSHSEITVEVRGNRITGGSTTEGIYNAAVQSFHPFIAYPNYTMARKADLMGWTYYTSNNIRFQDFRRA